MFAAASTRIVKDDDVKRIMGVPIGSAAQEPAQSQPGRLEPSPERTTSKPASAIRRGVDGFFFELVTCRANGGGVICEFTVTNEREDFALRLDNDSRMFDDKGRVYEATKLTVGNQETAKFGMGVTLVSGVRTPATITFDNVQSDSQQISLLEVKGYARNWYTLQFRNVPVSR